MSQFDFAPSTDCALIRSVVTHPKLYPWLRDDFSPEAANYRPSENPDLLYLTVHDDGELLGLWAFLPQNAICWELHTALLPSAWGARALMAMREMFGWIWNHTPCQRLVTSVPLDNRLALHFGLRAGMEEVGINSRSFLRRGKLQDQMILAVSRPEGSHLCR